MKALRLFLLGLFMLTWIPTGGVMVKHSGLDKMLARIAAQHPDSIDQIRKHTIPSAMCGVKTNLIANDSFHLHTFLPVTIFTPTMYLNSSHVAAVSINNESSLTPSLLLPPPRLRLA
jgi:hypothetical protein